MLLAIVGVDKRAGDAIGTSLPHLAGVGVEDVRAIDAHSNIVSTVVQDIDIGLTEDDEEIPPQLHEDHVGIVAGRRGLSARNGVLANRILVQLDTQAWPLRQIDLTFRDTRSTNE